MRKDQEPTQNPISAIVIDPGPDLEVAAMISSLHAAGFALVDRFYSGEDSKLAELVEQNQRVDVAFILSDYVGWAQPAGLLRQINPKPCIFAYSAKRAFDYLLPKIRADILALRS